MEVEMYLKNRKKKSDLCAYKCIFTLTEDDRRPLLNLCSRECAFTLAEVLITLAIIGIVAVVTIPTLVKKHNEHAWARAKDVFSKRLDVAMKTMNTDGTLTGYATTADFLNALKKNIKINQVCTDDMTKCFVKTVQWRQYGAPVTITNSNSIQLEEGNGYDWAEPVGVRFASGVNAILAYNKNCAEDPYNNQYSPAATCIGIIYDVTGNKAPNTNGKDIATNANIAKVAGQEPCVYQLQDGTCFAKILGPQNGGYTYLTNAECIQAKADGKIDVDDCYDGNDYYAGAVLACGGKKNNLPSQHQLALLATDVYNYNVGDSDKICADCTSSDYALVPSFTLNANKAFAFLAQSPFTDKFYIWSNTEDGSGGAYYRGFALDYTSYSDGYRLRDNYLFLAVCMGN